jgi:beta-lactamase class A
MNKLAQKIIIACMLLNGSYMVIAEPTRRTQRHQTNKKKKHKKSIRKTVRAARALTIQEELIKITRSASGECAVSAVHVESGQHFAVNEHLFMPMASVSKLAVALCCLHMVDEGSLSLDQPIEIRAHDLYQIDRADERVLLRKKVLYRTLRELIAVMIEMSDNPATDIILRHIGGVDAVNAYLQSIGVKDIHMNRTILQLLCDFSGYQRPPDPYHCTNGHYRALQAQADKDVQIAAEMKFYHDQRDRATAAAITDLLQQLYSGQLLSQSSTNFLLHCMGRLDHRGTRLGGALPDGATLMHKTGTMLGVTEYGIINDVGIITLPGGKGHVIVSVFINKSNAPRHVRTHVIARIARALCEYFS